MPNDQNALIYTSKGNLPIALLKRTEGWDFNFNGVTYWEQYTLDEVIVKRSAARFQLPVGSELHVKQGAIG